MSLKREPRRLPAAHAGDGAAALDWDDYGETRRPMVAMKGGS